MQSPDELHSSPEKPRRVPGSVGALPSLVTEPPSLHRALDARGLGLGLALDPSEGGEEGEPEGELLGGGAFSATPVRSVVRGTALLHSFVRSSLISTGACICHPTPVVAGLALLSEPAPSEAASAVCVGL
jgi:hypothetical protein